MKEGYSKNKPSEDDTIIGDGTIDLDNIPKELCPTKPTNTAPANVVNGKTTYGQRKHDGHCIILVKGKRTEKIYSRRMQDITSYVKDIPVIKEMMSKVEKGFFVLCEFVFHHTVLNKEIARFAAQVVTQEDAAEAMAAFVKNSQFGTYSCIPFDILFHNYDFVGNRDYTDRWLLLEVAKLNPPALLPYWSGETTMAIARAENWEGFVLRIPGEKSHVGYTLDGKAHRQGAWKWKFLVTDDFFVTEALYGKSGKHVNFLCKFYVNQYNSVGSIVGRGYVSGGTLSHEELKEITERYENKQLKLPFVVEIEYQSIHDKSGALQFGQIQRLRPDKTPEECIADD